MSVNTETQGSGASLEKIKWLIVAILLVVAIVGDYFYRDCNLLPRVLIIVFIIAIAGSVAMMTDKGKFIIAFTREARAEVRRVIWPNYQETLQTTLIVAIVTVVMSLIMWGLDGILVCLVPCITSLRF